MEEKNSTPDFAGLRNADTITVCKAFYESYGQEMIHRKFPEYESRIAVGLAGEGSECFGFDDAISRDHNFGLGFCMWLEKTDYDRIGSVLQEEYQRLLETEGKEFSRNVWGESVSLLNPRLGSRRGVMEIWQFYGGILKVSTDPEVLSGKHYWVYAEPRWLCTAVNGQVFRDDLGTFSSFRKEIEAFYPEKFFRYKLAEQLHLFSHGGQSNYPRMMARGDLAAGRLCIDQTLRSAMEIAYLLAKKYPPYYKWMFRGLQNLPVLKELPPLLEKLAMLTPDPEIWKGITYSSLKVFKQDPVVAVIEEIAVLLAEEMNRQGLIRGTDPFLESYVAGLTQA